LSDAGLHLADDNYLEALVVRGNASVVKSVAEHLIAVRGVKREKLTRGGAAGPIFRASALDVLSYLFLGLASSA
jgi:hypothetical protein